MASLTTQRLRCNPGLAHHVHGVPVADLENTRPVFGESDSTVWLLPDGRRVAPRQARFLFAG